MNAKTYSRRLVLAVLIWGSAWSAAPAAQAGKDGAEIPWGKPVDGLACRLVIQPRYGVGQAIAAVVEVKNTSNKKRYFVPNLDPFSFDHTTVELTGPKGKVEQTFFSRGRNLRVDHFQPIEPGEVKRFAVTDLRDFFLTLNEWRPNPSLGASGRISPSGATIRLADGNVVATGKYTGQLRFRSPKVPPRFLVSWSVDAGKKVSNYKDAPPEVTAGQWAGEIVSAPVAFDLAPLGNDDLVVHEWGVFTVFNDAKKANVNRKEEWGSLPSFFYRQFPKERLRWVPSAWDKPVVYFYAKQTPMRVSVKVTFADQGVPVVWWPAVADPVDDGGFRTAREPKTPRPFRSLTWEAWLGDQVPQTPLRDRHAPLMKVEDFALPADCWLKDARLPGASRLTVVGNIEGQPKVIFPGSKDRPETERFLYYDGLVPAPDYLRCEQVDAASVTLRNGTKFDLTSLFVVDRRVKDTVGFAAVGDQQAGRGGLKAGTSMKIEPKAIAAKDWPAAGIKQVRQALRDAGLFKEEADALLTIWQKRLLEAEGVTVFHILPPREYDRMLPLDILPAPAVKPVRVGIALHPHVEIEPELTIRVGALIRQLADAKFEKRAAASKALLEIGPLAIGMLRAELQREPTLEVRRRIEGVLERVDAADWLQLPGKAKKTEK
ncbi:MAG TPA: hypothetical protein VEL76_00770 [Gemmataceae bacterium]|nr:hypothetical protein [Gemmataceae bacterium]